MADGGILGIIRRSNPEREFEIVKQIGSGTYGEVYEAKVVKTGEKVALKIIKIEPGEDFNIIQQEIAILADCKHGNIVGYAGSYLRRDRLWIAMEFCGGGSLQDIYHALTGGLNELQIAFVCREILKGLAYLHERNKMHRDIKGANILLTGKGEVKLADFGIAAQLTQTLLMKRKSFIGTPYWMAPEVAAVEKKGGYNQQCDVWAVGITAVELAETQPPMFDLHPMRALYLMTKRNFKSPGLQHKNKWSENFHDFLRNALQKEPKRRPTAQELLKHDFVNRNALCAALMLPLITVLEAPPPKSHTPVDEDTEEEAEEQEDKQQKKNFKRIASVKSQAKIGKQVSDADLKNLNLVPSSNHDNMAWPSTADDPNYRPGIQKLSTVFDEDSSRSHVATSHDDYTDPDLEAASPPPYQQVAHNAPHNAPPVPPRAREEQVSPTNDAVYSNVDQPPVPPRQPKATPNAGGPPLPPKQPKETKSRRGKPSESDKRAYFSKIFNGCPLHLKCATSWVHPYTNAQYVLLGADEGLFSLQVVANNPDPVMEQVSSRACHWLRVVENSLIWISGNSRYLVTTNFILLYQTEGQQQNYGRGSRQSSHTARIPDSKNTVKCCISRNPFTDQRFLVAAVPRGILLMQWYQPQTAFKLVIVFEYSVPSPLHTLEAFIYEKEEYPIVCFGLKEAEDGRMIFDTYNLNTQASWYTDQPEGREVNVHCLQQLEKNTFFVGIGHTAKFLDQKGELKPSDMRASQVIFERKSEHMVYLSNCVLSFHKHGMQGKSLVTQQVTAEVADGSKVFHLLGSHGNIIIETRPLHDLSAPSNIYILVSED